jgi:rhodanese-related sulfurtransferase
VDHVAVPDIEIRGVDALLAAVRARIERLEPEVAWAAALAGEALIVDRRSRDERRRHGIVPGSLHIPRSVLEWRLDPASRWRNRHLGGLDQRLMLLCAEGFSSSLAAATLVDIGFERAGDIAGGFAGWRMAGVPVVEAPEGDDGGGALPGMGTLELGAVLPGRHRLAMID